MNEKIFLSEHELINILQSRPDLKRLYLGNPEFHGIMTMLEQSCSIEPLINSIGILCQEIEDLKHKLITTEVKRIEAVETNIKNKKDNGKWVETTKEEALKALNDRKHILMLNDTTNPMEQCLVVLKEDFTGKVDSLPTQGVDYFTHKFEPNKFFIWEEK